MGRLIWYKATGGNDRFHTYTFQQRIGVLVDWYRVLRSTSATIASPRGASSTIPPAASRATRIVLAKSPDETYGFDWCPGDDVLLKYVGKQGYVDPACGLKDAALDPKDPHTKAERSTSAIPPAISSSARPPAGWASASFRIRASTRRSGNR